MEETMKKIFLALLVSFFFAIPTNISADYNTDADSNLIENAAKDGVFLEKITTEELIQSLSKINNLSPTLVMKKYNINPLTRELLQHYRVAKAYNYNFTLDGHWGGSLAHEAYIDLEKTTDITSKAVYTIKGVYDCGIMLNSGEASWEQSTSHIVSWNSKQVEYYSSGNLNLTVSYSIGATVAGVVSSSVGSNYYYRLPKYYTSTINVSNR